jgi:hypothetical protein
MSSSPRRSSLLVLLGPMLFAVLFLGSPTVTASASTATPVMQPNKVTPQQLAAWYHSRAPAGYAVSVPVETLTRYFIAEGRADGVAGDLAFVQSLIETGWFRFGGQVTPQHNNFGGIGACDGGFCTVASFPTAQIGVRAQVQHLRAYADPGVTKSNLAYPLESPRFDLVQPKGRAPLWENMGGIDPIHGGVNWASDPEYSVKILNLYRELLAFATANGGLTTSFAYQDVTPTSSHSDDIHVLRDVGWTNGCWDGHRYCPRNNVTRAQMASFLVRAGNLAPTSRSIFADVPRTHTHHDDINALAAAGFTNGCGADRYCPDRAVTRAEMASFLQRVRGLPEGGVARFDDVRYGSTHGAAISAIADAGWTNGCGGGRNYCPDDPVSRQQMASFLRRAFLPNAAYRAVG